jgi:hypothetical protein
MTAKQRKICYPILLIIGLSLMAFQISIFRKTVIDLKILIGLILVAGVLAFVLDFKKYTKTYSYHGVGTYFYALMHYICGFGFIICSLFMCTNFYFADNVTEVKTFEINDHSSIPGRKFDSKKRKPTFKINYHGTIKTLVFSHEFYRKMNFYSKVTLETRKGFFGFDIIENEKLH